MKNINTVKFIAGFVAVIALAGFALPASADTTTAGYYDQFGNFHVYQTYTPPTNYYSGGNVYYGGNTGYNSYNPYNPGGYNTYSRSVVTSGQVTCATGELLDQFNNMCVPATRRGATAISGSGLDYGGSKTATTKPIASNDNYQSSAISTLFGGGKKASGKLEITNIVVTSGPKNIYDDKSDVNCEVSVAWSTSVAATGQVVYGTVSQPKIDSFSYPFSAAEGNSLQKTHEVKLGCLENVSYSFRVIAFSSGTDSQRVVSEEQTIFPIKIRTQIPTVGGASATGSANEAGASALATVGAIFTNPFVLIIIFGGIAYWVISRMLRKNKGGDHAAPAHAEPVLQIPHH